MDAWTFIWLMFLLKIPVVALFMLVRWAVRQTPEAAGEGEGGVGPRAQPRHPYHPRSPRPRRPRRGPHGEQPPRAPQRVRTRASRQRLPQR